MNRAVLSRYDLGPYRFDGHSLACMVEALDAVVRRAGAIDLTFRARLSTRTADGRVEAVSHDPSPLRDGSIPRPDSIELELGGWFPDAPADGGFLASLKLEPRGGDHVYVAGPAALAQEAFDEIVRRVDAAATPPVAAAPEPSALRVRRALGSQAVYWTLLAAGVACALCAVPLARTAACPVLIGVAFALSVLAFATTLVKPRTVHPTHEQRLDAKAAERIVDLSLPEEGPRAIERVRLLPPPGTTA